MHNVEEYLQSSYDKLFGFGTCAICSIALADSEMYSCRTYPDTVFSLLKRWGGLTKDNEVIWKRLKWILNIKTRAFLYNRKTKKHFDLDTIITPAIISVDGITATERYDSHFIFLRKIIYIDVKKDEILADLFCPIRGNKKTTLKKKETYSIINLEKLSND